MLVQVFVNENYASKVTNRRSVLESIVWGCLCVLDSRTQKCVTLSTTEAEYVAMAETM